MWYIKLPFVCILLGFIDIHPTCGTDFRTQKPTFLETCKISSPDFQKCFTLNMHHVGDQLKNGFPGIPQSFDPMRVSKVDFRGDGLNIDLQDADFIGFKDMTVGECRFNPTDFSFQIKIFVPRLTLVAHYTLDSKLLQIPLNGAGKMSIELDNMDMEMSSSALLYEKGGFKFLNVTRVRCDLNTTRVWSHFDDLSIGGTKDAYESDFFNGFFNRHWEDFYHEIRPLIQQTLELAINDLEPKIFHLIPATYFIEDISIKKDLVE